MPKDRSLKKLLSAALAVRARAYAPYSKFRVGAAVLGDDGKVYAGCNVENGSYPAGLCAERSAIAQAISRGARRIEAAVVVTPSQRPGPPCGICLQTFAELADGTMPVLLANTKGDEERTTLDDLLPRRFDKSFL